MEDVQALDKALPQPAERDILFSLTDYNLAAQVQVAAWPPARPGVRVHHGRDAHPPGHGLRAAGRGAPNGRHLHRLLPSGAVLSVRDYASPIHGNLRHGEYPRAQTSLQPIFCFYL